MDRLQLREVDLVPTHRLHQGEVVTLGHEDGQANKACMARNNRSSKSYSPSATPDCSKGMAKPVAFRAASIARLRSAPRTLKVSISVVGSSIRYLSAAAPP